MRSRHMNRQAAGTALVALVALAASAWGTWALFLRGHGLPPAWASAMILAVIALVSLPVALARRGPPRPPSAWALLGLAGALLLGATLLIAGGAAVAFR